ncbi:MAG TPA: DUF262 domain-containing HNH endonuclease family protein [Smithella sp.]|nr:DUF262 domain-containing HNH endonuclease family protein [Smithella sp.]
MKSDDITVQQLFQDRRQYMVPFYQRAYVWTRTRQWEQLWEDIRAKADARLLENKNIPHFLGAVVLDPQPRAGLKGVDTLHIIDGQQRLVTLQFILKSILLLLKANNITSITEIVAGALKNSNPDTMLDPAVEVFKVWPTFRDQQDYKFVLETDDRNKLKDIFPKSFTQRGDLRRIGVIHPPALEALWYFTDCFEKWIAQGSDGEISLRYEILATAILQDFKIVSIVLGEDDDAQVIFETLNGRGARLYATDLIRNFIFMRADKDRSNSEDLYNSMWAQFESADWNKIQKRGRMNKPKLEWFIHSTLQAELREEIDLGRLYFEYRRYVFNDHEAKTASDQLSMLTNYAKYYQALVEGIGEDPISIFGQRIAAFDITTLHPLALLIAVSSITSEAKKVMLDYLVSYVVRRAICGLSAKNYNNVFISVMRNLPETGISPESLMKILGDLKGEASRWPRNPEFRNVCINGSIYPDRLEAGKMREILAEIELELRQSTRVEDSFPQNLRHLDIDHILPKSWYEHWPLFDDSKTSWSESYRTNAKLLAGDQLSDRETAILAREKSIETLGNLTLLNLSVNREAQNKSFQVKRDLLLANTNLRLNIPLLGLNEWNEETIKTRGEQLADVALKVWPGLDAEEIN